MMDAENERHKPFPTAAEDTAVAQSTADTPQSRSPSYRLAFADRDFLLREELRPVRLQLELLKPELIQQDEGIVSTVVIFGSARIPDRETAEARLALAEERAHAAPQNRQLQRAVLVARRVVGNSVYYDEARKLGDMISRDTLASGPCDMVVITGGGPGIMEAANRGAADDQQLERLVEHLDMAAHGHEAAEHATDGNNKTNNNIHNVPPR